MTNNYSIIQLPLASGGVSETLNTIHSLWYSRWSADCYLLYAPERYALGC